VRSCGTTKDPQLSGMSPIGTIPCNKQWFKLNLFLDDLFVWTLHVLWEQQQRTNTQLKIGWFGTGRKEVVIQTNLEQCMWHDLPWISACPKGNGVTSSFDVYSIFHHFISGAGEMAGPYTRASDRKVKTSDPYLIFPPQMRVSTKWCSRAFEQKTD